MIGEQFPPTVRRAVLAALVVAVAGLALHQPVSIAAALAGLFVGVGIVGLASSPGRVTLAATVLPLGLVGIVTLVSVMAVGATLFPFGEIDGSSWGAATGLAATLLGLGIAGTAKESVAGDSVAKAGSSALVGAVLATVMMLTLSLLMAGGSDSGFEPSVLLTGERLGTFTGSVLLGTVAVVLAVISLPDGAVTSPGRREQFSTRRKRFAVFALVGAGLSVVLVTLAQFVGLSWLVSGILGSVLLRTVFAVLAALGLALFGFNLVVRWSWGRSEASRNDDVPILLGTFLSLTTILGVGFVLGVSPELLVLVPLLLGFAGGGLLGLAWLIGRLERNWSARGTLPVLLAGFCIAGTIAVAGDLGDTATLGWSGFGSVLTLGAGLFTYSAGRYGHTLSREIGTDGTRRTPQLVHVAFAVTVVTIGAVVAVGGFWIAMAVAPPLSVPATVGLVSALLATVILIRFLR